MRIATVAVVTGVVTVAIGGMLAFCRADGPAPAPSNAEPASQAPSVAAPAESEAPATPSPATRRWGDPEPAPVSPATVFAEELSAIRDRVGSVLPEDWKTFGAGAEQADRSEFAETIETLEASAPQEGMLTPFPVRADAGSTEDPPASADAGSDSIPSRLQEPPTAEPPVYEPDVEYFPPGPEGPLESPEGLAASTKLFSAAARDLERLAHLREEQRRYDEADRLRRLAMQLRRENRRILADPTSHPAYSEPTTGRR